MEIKKLGNGFYKVIDKDKIHYCYPNELYCTCKSCVISCKHIEEINNQLGTMINDDDIIH